MQACWDVVRKETDLSRRCTKHTGVREPGYVKVPVHDAWTQALRYSDRRGYIF